MLDILSYIHVVVVASSLVGVWLAEVAPYGDELAGFEAMSVSPKCIGMVHVWGAHALQGRCPHYGASTTHECGGRLILHESFGPDPELDPTGRVPDGCVVVHGRPTWLQMVPSPMCALSGHVSLTVRTPLGAWSCHGI